MEWPKIGVRTPISKIQEIHKRIWDYAIEHGEKPETPYSADCVLCEYASKVCNYLYKRTKTPRVACDICPYISNAQLMFSCVNGYYAKWYSCKDHDKKIELAKQIRDIPFKEEGYWKPYLTKEKLT